MQFVSRAAWGARAPKYGNYIHDVVGTTIHWEGPTQGTFSHTKCAAKVRGIQNYHMDTQGWADIAYTAIGCPHGYVFEGRGVGVRTAANGTDAGNTSWYAVCALVGQGDPITTALKTALNDAIFWLRDNGAGLLVNGHRDHKATECPGNALYQFAHGPHTVAAPAVAAPTPPPPPPPDAPEYEMRLIRRPSDGSIALVGALVFRPIGSIDQFNALRALWGEPLEVTDFMWNLYAQVQQGELSDLNAGLA